MIYSNLLGKRYCYDGKSIIPLTKAQEQARNSIRDKIISNEYKCEFVSCPSCSADDYQVLSQKDFYGFPATTVICRCCALVYASPRLSNKALIALYATEYRNLDRVLPESGDYFEQEACKAKMIEQFLKKCDVLSDLKGKCILEIGCGAGGGLHYFSKIGFQVAGCDLSHQNVEFGINQRLDIRYGNIDRLIEDFSNKSQKIGLIIYEQVFEHLVDPRDELRKLHEWLPENCLVYIGVPGLKNIHNHYGSDFLRYLQLPHLCHFELETLSRLVQNSGFHYLDGDETVRALFKRTNGKVSTKFNKTKYSEVVSYLHKIERQRSLKAPVKAVKNFIPEAGIWVQNQIKNSSIIPDSVKMLSIKILKKIYHEYFIKW